MNYGIIGKKIANGLGTLMVVASIVLILTIGYNMTKFNYQPYVQYDWILFIAVAFIVLLLGLVMVAYGSRRPKNKQKLDRLKENKI